MMRDGFSELNANKVAIGLVAALLTFVYTDLPERIGLVDAKSTSQQIELVKISAGQDVVKMQVEALSAQFKETAMAMTKQQELLTQTQQLQSSELSSIREQVRATTFRLDRVERTMEEPRHDR